jgi:hypothetical protein
MIGTRMLSEITKPKDIFLGITYPLTITDFIKDLSLNVNKEFSKNIQRQFKEEDPNTIWELRLTDIVAKIKSVANLLRKCGGYVQTNFSLDDLKKIKGYKVVILQAHYNTKERTVEFFDNKYLIEAIVQSIPKDYSGVFDLTVCNSDFLGYDIKKKFGNNCFVIQNKMETSLEVRLPVIETIIKILDNENVNYCAADVLIRKTLIKNLNEKK